MSTVLVVDAACDLPRPFLDQRNIKLLPVDIRINDQVVTDDKNAQKLTDFYARGLLTKEHNAESIPFSIEQIESLFNKEIVTQYDFALIQTVSRKRSPIYDNATKASLSILRSYKELRSQAGVEGAFAMRVMNTGTLFFTGRGFSLLLPVT